MRKNNGILFFLFLISLSFTAGAQINITVPSENLILYCDTTGLSAWLNDNGGAEAAGNCGEVFWSYNLPVITCNDSLEVVFTATDTCNNADSTTSILLIRDTSAPFTVSPPEPLILRCELSLVVKVSLIRTWNLDYGGWQTSDDCGGTLQDTLLHNETVINRVLNSNSCDTTFVPFIAMDSCGNSTTDTSYILIRDTVPPELPTLLVDDTLSCSASFTEELKNYLLSFGFQNPIDNCADSLQGTYQIISDSMILFSGSIPGGPFPQSLTGMCLESYAIRYDLEDHCGNSLSFTDHLVVIDTLPPQLQDLGQDTLTVSCELFDSTLAVLPFDVCSGVSADISTRIIDTGNMSPDQPRLVEAFYVLEDECNNSSLDTIYFKIIDTIAPFLSGADTLIYYNCTADIMTLDSASDNCDTSYILTRNDDTLFQSCGIVITRSWTAEDIAQNISTYQQILILQDTSVIEFGLQLSDTTVYCSEETDQIFMQWWESHLTTVSSLCRNVESFAALTSSIDPDSPATWPGITPDLSFLTCNDSAALDLFFITTSGCGDTIIRSARWRLIDTFPPEIICQADRELILPAGQCDSVIYFSIPPVSSMCVAGKMVAAYGDTAVITSSLPGSPNIIVDPVLLTIETPGLTATEDVVLEIKLLNSDTEQPQEYFYIIAENEDTLGITSPSNVQCSTSITTLSVSAPDYNNLAADGLFQIILSPFIPVNDPPRFGINDICGGSTATAELSVTGTAAAENFTILVNDIPLDSPKTVVSVGDHQITFRYTACNGLRDSCSFTLTVRDTIAPDITCPEDQIISLNSGSCDTLFAPPAPLLISDDCDPFNHILADQQNITFFNDPDLGVPVAEDILFQFLSPVPASDTVLLTLHIKGDIDSLTEYFSLSIEGEIIGTTEVGQPNVIPGNCDTFSLIQFSLPAMEFNDFISDDTLNVSLISFKDITSPGEGIQPCPSGNDLVQIEISYNSHAYILSINGDPFTDSLYLWKQGSNTLTYSTMDISGNVNSCSSEITVEDVTLPTADCRISTLFILPTDSSEVFIPPSLIDKGSIDDCGIENLSVMPSYIDCSALDTNLAVQLVVSDSSGNSDSCTTTLFVRPQPFSPSAMTDICFPDTLWLFANLPGAVDTSEVEVIWTGPAGFISAEINPVLGDVNGDNSGVYIITVTGSFGCSLTESVEVEIQETVPPLTSNDTIICEGETILLQTNEYSGNVIYKWYSGFAPGGMLIDSTSIPQFSLDRPPGTYNFYVEVTPENCASLISGSLEVVVAEIPVAMTADSFIFACEGTTVVLAAENVEPNLTYQWIGPGGYTALGPFPPPLTEVTLADAGSYQLFVSIGDCISQRAETVVEVQVRPSVPVLSPPPVYCPGDTAMLTVEFPATAEEYLWILPNNVEIVTDSPFLKVFSVDSGLLQVYSITNTCRSTEADSVVIVQEQDPGLEILTASEVCSNEQLVLSSNLDPQDYEFNWSGPEGFFSSLAEPILTPKEGKYFLTVESINHCIYKDSFELQVREAPEIISIDNIGLLCVSGDADVCFSASFNPIDTGQYTYTWTGPNNYVSPDSAPCIFDATTVDNGTYSLVIADEHCMSNPASTVLNILDFTAEPFLSGDTVICEGAILQLFTDTFPGIGVEYVWETPAGSQITTRPQLEIQGFSEADSGAYRVAVRLLDCMTRFSDSLFVDFIQLPPSPPLPGVITVCEKDTFTLDAESPPGVLVTWRTPTGDLLTSDSLLLENISAADSGLYSVQFSRDMCTGPIAEFYLNVEKVPPAPGWPSADTVICADGETLFCPLNSDSSLFYNFSLDGIPLGLTDSCIVLSLQQGSYQLTIAANTPFCRSELSSLNITVVSAPDSTMLTDTTLFTCNEEVYYSPPVDDELNIQVLAESPLVVDPSVYPDIYLSGIPEGENTIRILYSTDICADFATSETVVTRYSPPFAQNDTLILSGGQGLKLNLLENDIGEDLIIKELINSPTEVQLDDSVLFVPAGTNSYTFHYISCLEPCPLICDTAEVFLLDLGLGECFITNIITPNNDGLNDRWMVNCENLPGDLNVSIFNQFGDLVYSKDGYKSDWEGTYNGEKLPVGTYYYVLEAEYLSSRKSGYIVIKY